MTLGFSSTKALNSVEVSRYAVTENLSGTTSVLLGGV